MLGWPTKRVVNKIIVRKEKEGKKHNQKVKEKTNNNTQQNNVEKRTRKLEPKTYFIFHVRTFDI